MKRYLAALVISCCLLTAAICVFTHQASATITNYISFQGKLTNPDGTNVTNNTYTIRFRIYTDPSADTGTCANTCKWEESKSVTVTDGLFQTNLGDTTSLPGSVPFNSSALYLGVKVGSDAEMTPRVQLTAVPQAFNADNLDGIDSNGFVQLSPGSQQSGNINISGTVTSGAVNGVSVGTTIQPSSAGALTVQSNGSNALTLTGGAASTWSTTAGGLTVQGFAGLTLNTPQTNSSSTNSSGITIISGNAAGTTSNSGDVTIDVGTATGSLGTITVGHSGVPVNIAGNLTLANSTSFSGTTARSITGPSTGGLSVTVASGPLTLSTTTSGTLAVTSAGALNLTGAAASAWDVGNNTLSIQTANNGAITTGTGTLTQGGNITFSGSSARTLTGPSTGGLTVTVASGPLSISTTTSGTLAINSAGVLNLSANAASTWDIGNNTLSLQTTNNGAITSGSGLFTMGGSLTFSGTSARTITGPGTGGLTINVTSGPLTLSTTTSGLLTIQGSGGVAITAGSSNITIGTSDTTGTLLVLDTKTSTGDPTGVNGGLYYNSSNNKFRCFENSIWQNCIPASNSSTADQSVGASTTAYLTGSLINIPSSGVHVGSTFTWKVTMSKTAAGTVANTFDVRVGTNGTAADTSRLSFAMSTETAAADTAVVTITATVRSVSSTSTWAGNYSMLHNLSTTGFDSALSAKTINVTSGTFDDTTAGLKVGVSITTGASYALTIQQVIATTTLL